MPEIPTPFSILKTLLPHLKVAAAYAREIQARIAKLPDKTNASANPFAAALTDADLSVQTFVEVALLGCFPDLRFYGEEYEKSYNTKYFRAIDLGPTGDYLITLDPIDGTRLYIDGHPNYQIILSILNADDYEAVLAISPSLDIYYYALRGQGTFKGKLSEDDLEACQPLKLDSPKNTVLLGSRMSWLAKALKVNYAVIDVAADYSQMRPTPNVNGILCGDLTGAAISAGKFIDGAALAFLAREAGYIVTLLDGSLPPPLHICKDYQQPGLVIASSTQVHQNLLDAVVRSRPS